MLLAHRRRTGPGRTRARTGDKSLGAVLVEAAFVTPVFFILVFGIVEVGLAMNDNLALANTARSGTRVASASGNDLYADYGIIQAVRRESAALPKSSVKLVVVYRASGLGGEPSANCKNNLPQNPGTSTTAEACNTYVPSEFDDPKADWGCSKTSLDANWCPTKRKVSLTGTGTEYVGVWVKIEHDWLTNMFGSKVTLTDHSVIRLEPRIK